MSKNKVSKQVIEQIKDPVDSSMMFGAFRAVDGIRDVYPYFNSPVGCPFHMLIAWSRHKRDTMMYSHSMIMESDVIMGFNEKLEANLNKAIDSLPDSMKAIAVISSDAAEIILPDVERIANKITEERGHKVKIIPLPVAGFKGNHIDGFNVAMLKFISSFFKKSNDTIPKSVNLLGIVQDEIAARSDVVEVKRLLNAIGISVISTMLVDLSTEEISNAGTAECNIVLHEEYGLQSAKYLEKEFGIPYICESPPFGIEGTTDWLLKVGKHFGLKEEARNFIESEEAKVYPLIVQADQYLTGRRFAVYADPTKALGITRLGAELGMEPMVVGFTVESEVAASFLDGIIKKYDIAPELLFEDNINFRFMVKELKPQVLFGTSFHYELSYEIGAYHVPISFPTNNHLRICEPPFMGYQGVLHMAQKLGDEFATRVIFDETVHGVRYLDNLDI